MSKITSFKKKEHGTELDAANTTAQFKRGFEPKDFWASGMRVWSDRQLLDNKVVRMYGLVTGILTRLVVPANFPDSPAITTLRVRVRWDSFESEALLDPYELVPYTELENTPGNSSCLTNSEAEASFRRCQT